jgi:hypothetical protein
MPLDAYSKLSITVLSQRAHTQKGKQHEKNNQHPQLAQTSRTLQPSHPNRQHTIHLRPTRHRPQNQQPHNFSRYKTANPTGHAKHPSHPHSSKLQPKRHHTNHRIPLLNDSLCRLQHRIRQILPNRPPSTSHSSLRTKIRRTRRNLRHRVQKEHRASNR